MLTSWSDQGRCHRGGALRLRTGLALIVGLCVPVAVSPAVMAQPLLIVPGAEYVNLDALPHNPLIDAYYTRSIDIGRGFFPDSTPVVVDYPATVYGGGSIGKHIAAGATIVDTAIKAAAGPVIVAGQSEGCVVVDLEAARLQTDPNAPAADQVTFSVFGDPMRGFLNTLFKDGTRIPIVGLTVASPVESRYNTIVVTGEYDLWGDFPDRPWNMLALANAMMGSTFVHARASFSPSDIPPENVSVSINSLGGTTTSYLVPTKNLPLTEPLRLIGVPAKIVDALDNALRPRIDAGYSRNDAPGSKRPYLSHGVLHTGGKPAAASASAVTANVHPLSSRQAPVHQPSTAHQIGRTSPGSPHAPR